MIDDESQANPAGAFGVGDGSGCATYQQDLCNLNDLLDRGPNGVRYNCCVIAKKVAME
jgi:hypothetical protein